MSLRSENRYRDRGEALPGVLIFGLLRKPNRQTARPVMGRISIQTL